MVVGRIKRHYIAELGHYEEHSDGSNLTSVLVFEKKYIHERKLFWFKNNPYSAMSCDLKEVA